MFRGRGRFSNTRREEKSYSKDLCEEEINSFVAEPVSGRKSRDKDSLCTRIRVSNIPLTMSEVTLRELFSKYGFPTVYISNSTNSENRNKWGFIDYESAHEASLALANLNKAPPHNLLLKLINVAEDYSESEDFKKEIQPCEEREPVRHQGRGGHIPIMGRAPNSYRSKKPSFENYSGNSENDPHGQYSNTKFRLDGTPSDITKAKEYYGNMSRTQQGSRSVTMGRGVYRNDKVEKVLIPDIPARVEDRIDKYMHNVILQPKREDVRVYQSEDDLPFETGNCPCCKRPSSFICCKCKQWYCSSDCVREHIATTGGGCQLNKKSLEKQEDDYLIDKKFYERYDASQRNEANVNDQYEGKHSRGDIEPRENRGNRMSNGRNEKNDHAEDRSSNRRKEGQNMRTGSRTTITDGEEEGYNTSQNNRSDGNNRRSGGNDRKFGTNGNSRFSGGQGHRFQQKRNHQERKPVSNRNNYDNDVYVRGEVKASPKTPICRTSSECLNESEVNAEFKEEDLLSSHDGPFEVIVSSVTENDNIYWVYKKSSLQDLLDLMQALNSLNKSSKPVVPDIDFACAAPFAGDCYRAKILNVMEKKSTALVRFIDYGNEANVNIQDLKLLPKELVSKPPLAFKIYIQGPTVKLEENDEIVINVIQADSSGAWKVNIVNDTCEATNEAVAVNEDCEISYDHFDVVHIMDGTNGEYCVQLEHNVMKIVKMNEVLGKYESNKVQPVLGELYVRNYSGTWCRAKVIKEKPLTVYYIDYGNSEVVDIKDLHPLPKEYRNVPGLVIKIRLAEGTSEKYYNLKFSESLSVKAVNKLDDGIFIVHVKGEKYAQAKNEHNYPKGVYFDKKRESKQLISIVRDADRNAAVCIQKVMSCECVTGYLTLKVKHTDYLNTSELSILLKELEPSHDYTPNVGDLVVARVGKTWCRAYVMLITEEEVNVALIDFGKVVSVNPNKLMLLPTRFQTNPLRQAVRVVLTTPLESLHGLLGNVVNLTNVKKTNDILKCKFGEHGEAEIIPWVPLIEEAGLRVFPLRSNSLVVVSAYHTPRSVYVRPASKDMSIKFAELLNDIMSYSTKAELLNRKPLCGELVCARYCEDKKFYRAQIYEKADDNTYKINFVDFGNTEVVSLSDLQPLPDTFKKVPCFAVKVGLKDIIAHTFNPQAMTYLNRICLSQTTLLLTYDDTLGEVTISEQDGKVLNSDLVDLMEHSLKSLGMPSNEANIKLHPFMGSDVIYEKWPLLTRFNIAAVSVTDHKTVLGLSESSKLIDHLVNYLTPKISKYCKECPHKVYNPRSNEIVLAKYTDDEGGVEWYRAVCIKPMMSSTFVLFIDYGNCGELPHSDIRCMPPEFMDTPAALKKCSIYGISDNISNDMKDKIKQKLKDLHGEGIVLEDDSNGNVSLWTPSIYPFLQSIGHPPVDPPPGV